eukprot:765153-Amphidinium_carterae.1
MASCEHHHPMDILMRAFYTSVQTGHIIDLLSSTVYKRRGRATGCKGSSGTSSENGVRSKLTDAFDKLCLSLGSPPPNLSVGNVVDWKTRSVPHICLSAIAWGSG